MPKCIQSQRVCKNEWVLGVGGWGGSEWMSLSGKGNSASNYPANEAGKIQFHSQFFSDR